MSFASSPTSLSRLATRRLALLLSTLLLALPLAGQSSSGSATALASATKKPASSAALKPARKPTQSANKSATAAKKTAKPSGAVKKSTAKPASQATKARANSGGSPRKTAAKPARHAAKPSKKPVSAKLRAARRAHTARIKLAFVASAELRPMAQQLATMRTPAAYAGVTKYAQRHTGEAAGAAYLALGHAYLLDKRYGEAITDFGLARKASAELADYADFLNARANHDVGNEETASALLHGFAERYPESIFVAQAPELEAEVLLALKDAAGAERVLAAAAETAAALRPGYQFAQAEAAFDLGQEQQAASLYKTLLLAHPLSAEAEMARAKLTAIGAETTLTTAELRSLADAYWNAGHYQDANEQYRALAAKQSLDAVSRNGFAVAAAACELKLKRLTTAQAEALPDTTGENGARRLYLLMELARGRDDLDEQKRIVAEMESSFPQSPWLAEALYDSGNIYLLRREYPAAVEYYSALATRFPNSSHAAAAHWRAGWLSYRQGLFSNAARLFDEQIRLYPGAKETVSALYWRGRLYETEDHNPALAAASYRTILRAYQHYFYAQMARQRLNALGNAPTSPQPQLDSFQPPPVPPLVESFPADSPHLAKARLLANAGLNDYIAQEIAADPDSSDWSALAEAQIYASYGEAFRAMRSLKRALPSAATASMNAIPLVYWRILFPHPWWETIQAEAAKNNLDPYLVASLIRQESEFNPSAISPANAYGLMQLLPSVGKSLARQEGIDHFQTYQLLDPETNIRLGTRYLRQTLNKFGGVTEYALAAYNAGDDRVLDWQAAGPYQGIDEFVESIPFTETREYVEAIERNIETYKQIDAAARP